jgi:hypothetical protein
MAVLEQKARFMGAGKKGLVHVLLMGGEHEQGRAKHHRHQ